MDYLKNRRKQKINPVENTNILWQLFFTYTRKIFVKGFKRQLNENDIYEVLPSYKSNNLGKKLEHLCEIQQTRKRFSMMFLLWKCFGLEYILISSILLTQVAIIILRPKIFKNFLAYYSKNNTLSKHDAWVYGTCLVVIFFVDCLIRDNITLRIETLAIKMRTAFTSLIYRKVLRISSTQVETVSVGKIITLITRDVNEFEVSIPYIITLLNNLVYFIVVCYVLYKEIGWLVITLIGTFCIVISIQVCLAPVTINLKRRTLMKTDDRLKTTREMLIGIRPVKFYRLEDMFQKKLSNSRKDEVCLIYKIQLMLATKISLSISLLTVTWYLLIVISIYLGDHIKPEILFLIMDSLNNLMLTLNVQFPKGIHEFVKLKAVFRRISKFLQTKEKVVCKNQGEDCNEAILSNLTVYVNDHKIFNNINFKLQKGLTILTGPMGSGKTLLLKVLMREYQFIEGDLKLAGEISYASQESWLFPSTMKQNILFGSSYDKERYNEVLELCELRKDLEAFDEGDDTIVADRGTNLSGGQQKRINLARAIYRKSDTYLLDDCLTNLDVVVANSIFEKCIKGFLKNKTVIMISQNEKYVNRADNILTINEGLVNLLQNVSAQKAFSYKSATTQENHLLVPPTQEHQEGDLYSNENATLIEPKVSEKNIYEESKELAQVKMETYRTYFRQGGGIKILLLICVVFCATQFSKSSIRKLEANWVNIEQNILHYTNHNGTMTENYKINIQKRQRMIYLLPILLALLVTLMLCKASIFYLVAKRASVNIHNLVVSKVIRASMEFFDNHFMGNILNRFSEDLHYLDEKVPVLIYVAAGFLVEAVITTGLIMTINTLFIIPSLLFFVIMVITTIIYLRTGRPLKQLEISTRSPFIGHINATIEGLCTVKASRVENILCDEFDSHQDLYTSATYMYFCCLRAYAFVVHIFSTIFIAVVVFRLLILDNEPSIGKVGLLLSQTFLLTRIYHLAFHKWARLVTRMTAVERILAYTNQKQESEDGVVLKNWPASGEIKYENVYISYKHRRNFVLKDLNFTIKSGEKVAVVGRTGAGKTSLISAFLKLCKVHGRIFYDGVNIANLSLNALRSNISVVCQEPFLYSGTIRENIDPFGQYSDDRVWDVIKTIKLESLFSTLEYKICGSDCNLSMSQKQLICLGRAIIRNNKVIILDEITANVDTEMEVLIHRIVKTYVDCTVLMITHKLSFLEEYDKIMVMNEGRIIEFDRPSVLLNDKQGMFYNMFNI